MEEVKVVDYDDSRHHEAFKSLNEQWINSLFVIEDIDRYEINHPVENILQKGGCIFIAELGGKAVGTVALMKSAKPQYDYELVKFSVDPDTQGKGIGKLLLARCLAKAKELGARKLFLEGNHKCGPANHLYYKFGFREVPIESAEYARCDIQMALDL